MTKMKRKSKLFPVRRHPESHFEQNSWMVEEALSFLATRNIDQSTKKQCYIILSHRKELTEVEYQPRKTGEITTGKFKTEISVERLEYY